MRTPVALALVLVSFGCSGQTAREQAAIAAFDRYQDALFAGDRARLRRLVAHESRAVVPDLPLERLRGKQRLEVLGAERLDPEVLLRVRDPNAEGATTTYVVVVEGGQLLVDLIATTAYNHATRHTPGGGGMNFTPRRLTEAELARVQDLAPR